MNTATATTTSNVNVVTSAKRGRPATALVFPKYAFTVGALHFYNKGLTRMAIQARITNMIKAGTLTKLPVEVKRSSHKRGRKAFKFAFANSASA
jgi:hypothetical protein